MQRLFFSPVVLLLRNIDGRCLPGGRCVVYDHAPAALVASIDVGRNDNEVRFFALSDMYVFLHKMYRQIIAMNRTHGIDLKSEMRIT